MPWQPREPPGARSSAGALYSSGGGSSGLSRARCDLTQSPRIAPGWALGPPRGSPPAPEPTRSLVPMELLAAAFSAACAVDHDSSTSESDTRDSAAGHLPGR